MVDVLAVGRGGDDSEALERAVRTLAAGGLVAVPTETVYGLAARADDGEAVARIFAAKGRPAHNPLIVHVPDAAAARAVAAAWPDAAARLAAAFWPGPLSLVVPRGERVHPSVTAGGSTIAVRAPAVAVTRELLARLGLPVAAPSANRSESLSPTTAQHVVSGLGDRVDLVLDAGPCAVGIESTVVDVSVEPPRLLRPGSVTAVDLARILPTLALDPPPRDAPARSPGLARRHYAPRARVVLAATADVAAALADAEDPAGLLTLHARPALAPAWQRHLGSDPAAYARGLFAALHDADAAHCRTLVVELPPDSEPWRAIRDRLTRASATA